jgi:chromate reductase, NAD(P)H dehydrogenase (quinone)
MMQKKKIVALIGSTKRDSMNLKIVQQFIDMTKDSLDVDIFPIHLLPFFNPDLENRKQLATSVARFRESIDAADGVLICTPEYVFSLPGILKNALEWTVSTIVFNDKPTALITASSVGEKAHASLELVMRTIGAKIGDKSSLLIQNVKTKVNAHGEFTNAQTLAAFEDLIRDFTLAVARP